MADPPTGRSTRVGPPPFTWPRFTAEIFQQPTVIPLSVPPINPFADRSIVPYTMESNVCPVVFVAQYYRSLRSLKLTSPSTSILLLNADTYTTLLLATRDTHGSPMPLLPL